MAARERDSRIGQRPALASQSLATLEASGLSGAASLVLRSVSVLVSSLAETALRASFTVSLALLVLISGSTFWAAKLNFGSSSTTQPFFWMVLSVVNMSAAWMLPWVSAATVSGPSASSDVKLLNVQL